MVGTDSQRELRQIVLQPVFIVAVLGGYGRLGCHYASYDGDDGDDIDSAPEILIVQAIMAVEEFRKNDNQECKTQTIRR